MCAVQMYLHEKAYSYMKCHVIQTVDSLLLLEILCNQTADSLLLHEMLCNQISKKLTKMGYQFSNISDIGRYQLFKRIFCDR